MSAKEIFKKWLENESYDPLVLDAGRSTKTLLLKISKNENFDYLFQQTFYNGSHIERDAHLTFSGVYCKKDGQVYCAYNHLKQTVPEFEWGKGQYDMSQEMTDKVCQMINETVISNPQIYSTIRPISEESEKYMERYRENVVEFLARRNFIAGNLSGEIEYDCRYEFNGWTENNLLEYILEPQKFINNEHDGYLSAHIEDILVNLRENEALRESLEKLENMEDSPLHRVKKIIAAVNNTDAKTVKVSILKDGKEFSFKSLANVFHRDPISSYNRWNITSGDRYQYEKLFGREDYRPEEITEISYKGKPIYSAEPYEPAVSENMIQTM